MKKPLSLPRLVLLLRQAGHVVFERDDRPYNLNIVGVRSRNPIANRFDDWLYVFWQYRGSWSFLHFPITTDPGCFWLQNPMRTQGTAILKPGQYRGAYAIDLHAGRYEALCQRYGSVRVYRDNDKDCVLDFNDESSEKGFFGINIHRAALGGDTVDVDKWSAGCQVFANSHDFDLFMLLCKRAAAIWGNRFTYTLLAEG